MSDTSDPDRKGLKPNASASEPPDRKGSGDVVPSSEGRSGAAQLLGRSPHEFAESLHFLLAKWQLDGQPPPQCIGVVSASHGEGVTTISRALAAVFVQDLDTEVCLVDVNSPPSGPREDGPRPGLFEVMTGAVSLPDVYQPTVDPRLKVLPAGGTSRNDVRSVLRLPGLESVFDGLRKDFTHIIVDVPPLLAGSPGLALCRHLDEYLLIVKYGATTVDQVGTVADELKLIPCMGVVVNSYASKIPARFRRLLLRS